MNWGIEHINKACNKAQSVFVPFVEYGYPTIEQSVEAIRALAKMGATVIEVGVASHNPFLDGEVITNANRVAMQNGADLFKCMKSIKKLRDDGIETPIMLMSYMDVFEQEKFQNIVRRCRIVGVDGFLIPDLDVTSRQIYKKVCLQNGLSLTDFITPNHTQTEIEKIMREATGFIYGISTTGKTGVGSQRAEGLDKMVKAVRKSGNLPIALGFGMSTKYDAKSHAPIADGIIVGSALVQRMDGSLKRVIDHASDMQIASL